MRYTTLEVQTHSNDNVHTLYGKIYIPIGTPKATFQIIHGMSEHIELYDEFMSKLARCGYVVLIHDQLGHGKTSEGIDKLGFFAQKNGDTLLVEDAYSFAREFLSDYSGLKHILFGHSMGSFIARICCEKYSDMCDMLILSGTGGHQKGSGLGIAVTHAGGRVYGEEYRSEISQKLFLDYCNIQFRDDQNDYAWTTSDISVQKHHLEDKYYNFVFSVKAMNDVVTLIVNCNSEEWYDTYRTDLQTLILSGEKDPVGDYGKGVLEVYKKLKERGVRDITLKLYKDRRHELLHEINRYEVCDDIIMWLAHRL